MAYIQNRYQIRYLNCSRTRWMSFMLESIRILKASSMKQILWMTYLNFMWEIYSKSNIQIVRSRNFHREFERKITQRIPSIKVSYCIFFSKWRRFQIISIVKLYFSKTCEIEKDHLVDKTTQQAEQIRKSIRNLHQS